MHTVDLLEQALACAERLGYRARQEWLGGQGGGVCEYSGQKWLFLDLAMNASEQLEQVRLVLESDPAIFLADLSPALNQWLDTGRRAA